MVAYGSLVFLWGDRGVVTCIDSRTGKQHWHERVGGTFSSSPVRVADRIYGSERRWRSRDSGRDRYI